MAMVASCISLVDYAKMSILLTLLCLLLEIRRELSAPDMNEYTISMFNKGLHFIPLTSSTTTG